MQVILHNTAFMKWECSIQGMQALHATIVGVSGNKCKYCVRQEGYDGGSEKLKGPFILYGPGLS